MLRRLAPAAASPLQHCHGRFQRAAGLSPALRAHPSQPLNCGDGTAACVLRQLRNFARRRPLTPQPVPLVMTPPGQTGGHVLPQRTGAPPADPQDRDWSQRPPVPPPRRGGFRPPRKMAPGGVDPRLSALKTRHSDYIMKAPFEDPTSKPYGEPIEEDRPPPMFKVLRTHNGNLPVYEKYKRHGTEASTIVRHVFGDQDAMRRELMMICEAPVRIRSGQFEVRGMHVWKVKEWLVSLGF
eukprot:TRINITY_DN41230_c0_g2_i1.p1 TRINITY_DN41230_c0_g2~~TRINITY_DN41230_c0_g2_i1.p1  ORF type:complete len:239 (-),score=33.44 TRINITY_DN41230_c0_g2_i1:83-799(-)